jgi:hypothetical protein
MRRLARGFAIALCFAALGCAQTITDVDRTRDNKTAKSLFEGQWFMLSTVVDTPAQTSHTFIGLQGSHEMIEWDIQESWLIAYRVHEHVEGSEAYGQREGTTYRGAAVAAYPIERHFDIKRSYSGATGEQSNVLSENGSDRPWYQRDYIRVSWGNNRIADMTFGPDNFRVTSGGDILHERQGCEEPGSTDCEPGALDVAEDHINITTRVIVAPINSSACFMAWGIAWEADDSTLDCEAAEVKVRTSFLKVDAERENTYTPLYHNDQQYDKFGIFRSDRFAYNRDYGVRESSRKDMGQRWQIWQEASDDQGNIPYADRETRPIVFYVNAEFPNDTTLLDGNDRVEAEWDRVFREAVAAARNDGSTADDVEQMFYICDNPVPEGAPAACGAPGTSPLLGDIRFPMIHYTNQPHLSSPLGYGPSSANPLTGRIYHATANIYGASLSTYAQYATDMVKLLNDDLSMEDYLGDYFADQLNNDTQRLTMHAAMDSSMLKNLAMDSKLDRTRESLVRAINSGDLESDWSEPIRERLRGTTLETAGMTPEMVHGLTGGKLAHTDERAPQVSPVNMLGTDWRKQQKARDRFRERNGCILAPEFDDAAVLLVAQRLARDPALKNPDGSMNYDLVRNKVMQDIYVGVLLHELGHTVGMAHNFASSNDSINFHDEYWEIRAQQDDVQPFFSMSPEARATAMSATNIEGKGLKEYQYSSIMEYGRRWMSDIALLGKYDQAFVKYSYGRTVEVWDHQGVQATRYDGLKEKLKPHNYHYSMYPKIFAFGSNMGDRDATLRFAQRKNVPISEVGEGEGFTYSPDQEVYYRFCDNTHDGRFGWCRPFDEGADQWEQVAAVVDDYEGYYPFYNFRRDRLGFGNNINSYLNRIMGRYDDISAQYKHFVNEQMFLRGDQDCIHPVTGQPVQEDGRNLKPWESTICGGDGHAASRLGFDLFARVMQQPDVGTYIWNTELNVYQGFDRRINERTALPSQQLPDLSEDPQYDLDRRFELNSAPARDHETRFDRDRYGYGFYYKPLSIGVWWDKYMALNAMIAPGENFAYTDTRPELLRYNINWSLLFPGEMLNIAGAAASQAYNAYAPLYDGEKVVWRRFATATQAEKNTYAGMEVVSPGDSFSVRFLSVLMGTAWMPQVTMDKTFNQAFKIGVVGAQDQFDVSDEVKADPNLYVELKDPITHRVYYAVNTGRIADSVGDYGGAAAISPGYELLKRTRDLYLDDQGELRADKVALEVAQRVDGEIEDRTDELIDAANASDVCINAADSAENRRACNRARADAVRNGQTEGRALAEASARHLLRAQLHNAFYFPDLIRGYVYAYENW